MNYQTAQLWIAALNADNGVGYLGRNNWQLPTTQTHHRRVHEQRQEW